MIDALVDTGAGVVINMIIGIATGIRVDMPDDVDTNVLEFDTPAAPREEEPIPLCWPAACKCWPIPILLLQAWMPSYHVRSSFALPAVPQFRNHEPPRPQQLRLFDLPIFPHLWHTELMIVLPVVIASV